MSTPDAARRSPTDSDARASDRHALIEQLLLAGLDHYFVGQYDQAIHVWTRVYFVDRGHTRARAYIERARCALAERQREAEAYGAEEGLASAQVGGGALVAVSMPVTRVSDELPPAASAAPRRISRRDLWRGAREAAVAERSATKAGGRLRNHVILVTLAVVLLCSAGYVVVARDRLDAWWRMPAMDAPAGVPLVAPEPLPLPRASEQTLARARSLFARGHLHEALQALTIVGADDPLRREADALLGDVERAILESAGLRTAAPSRPPAALLPDAAVPLPER